MSNINLDQTEAERKMEMILPGSDVPKFNKTLKQNNTNRTEQSNAKDKR